MAKKNKKVSLSQQEKAALKKLREKGLYKPKNARKPTKYGKSLISKFSDVLTGKSKAVKTDRKTVAKYHREKAKPGEVRTKGDRIIVPVLPGEKAVYSRKRKEVEVYREIETGQRYVRTPFEKRPKSYDALKAQLKEGDRIAVPYYRGKNKPVEWSYFDEVEFYNTFIGGYSKKETEQAREKALEWALEGVQISRYIERRK